MPHRCSGHCLPSTMHSNYSWYGNIRTGFWCRSWGKMCSKPTELSLPATHPGLHILTCLYFLILLFSSLEHNMSASAASWRAFSVTSEQRSTPALYHTPFRLALDCWRTIQTIARRGWIIKRQPLPKVLCRLQRRFVVIDRNVHTIKVQPRSLQQLLGTTHGSYQIFQKIEYPWFFSKDAIHNVVCTCIFSNSLSLWANVCLLALVPSGKHFFCDPGPLSCTAAPLLLALDFWARSQKAFDY